MLSIRTRARADLPEAGKAKKETVRSVVREARIIYTPFERFMRYAQAAYGAKSKREIQLI